MGLVGEDVGALALASDVDKLPSTVCRGRDGASVGKSMSWHVERFSVFTEGTFGAVYIVVEVYDERGGTIQRLAFPC